MFMTLVRLLIYSHSLSSVENIIADLGTLRMVSNRRLVTRRLSLIIRWRKLDLAPIAMTGDLAACQQVLGNPGHVAIVAIAI